VRQQAETIKCAANLRQLGQAMTMYTQQYRFFPTADISVAGGESAQCWPVRLRKLLNGNRKVFYCPAQPAACEWKLDAPGSVQLAAEEHTTFGYNVGERLLLTGLGPGLGAWFSYGINGIGAPGLPPHPRPRGTGGLRYHIPLTPPFNILGQPSVLRGTSIRSPAEFILIADSTADGSRDLGVYPIHSSASRDDIIGDVHRGGPNILFMDGHVQWYLQKDVTIKWPPVPEDSAKQRMWNADNEPSQPW
jgi:prepilin-type processing-associated H-X9-DG protein